MGGMGFLERIVRHGVGLRIIPESMQDDHYQLDNW